MAPTDPLDVCITFDFDAMCMWAGVQESPTLLSRGEFAGRVGVPRILDLLAREEVKATFFTPGHTIESFPDLCRRILDEGHEIGHHGYFHETPVNIDPAEERAILEKGLDAMDRCLGGYRAKGYRSPAWDLSANSTKLLKELGFLYDSSMMAMDFEPYWCRTGDRIHRDGPYEFGRELDLVEIPVSYSLDDAPLLEFLIMGGGAVLPGANSPKDLEERWLADLDFAAEEVPDGVFTMTFHPDSIGRGARIRVVQNMIHRARELGARFAKTSEVAERWRADAPAPAPARVGA
jgi:peptidoglycan/xylan/chitin deacetylase (PgdA/CDA1 family)